MKDHTPTRARFVLEEVVMGRVEPTRAAVRAHVDDVFQGVREIERTTVVSAVMREIKSWKTTKERKPMSEPKGVLRGKAIIPVAAEFFRDDPEATGADVYRRMLQAGYKIPMKCASFEAAYAGDARELAQNGDAAPAPKPPAREPEPEPAVEAPPSDDAVETMAVAPTRTAAPVEASDGDFIRFQLGGQKLDAARTDDEWAIAFEGTVGDSMVRELLGRMFGGSR